MKKALVLMVLALVIYACSDAEKPQEEEKTEIVMAEFSELALLMKDIHKDAKSWRTKVVEGELVTDSVAIYEALVSSTPTKAEVKGPVFEGFAASYQEKLNSFLSARNESMAKESYNNLVQSCVACHKTYCPGPVPTIEKLYVPQS